MKPTITALAAILALTACSPRFMHVQGRMDDSTETFAGRAADYAKNAGTMHIKMESGTTCKGDYTFANEAEGKGEFFCSDGARAPFTFVKKGKMFEGTGTMRGTPFTFTFG